MRRNSSLVTFAKALFSRSPARHRTTNQGKDKKKTPLKETHEKRLQTEMYKEYYIKTRYDKDCLELIRHATNPANQWDEGNFDWGQNIKENLELHLRELSPDDLMKTALIVLPYSDKFSRSDFDTMLRNGLPPISSSKSNEIIKEIVELRFLALTIWVNHIACMEQLAVDPFNTASHRYKRYVLLQELSSKLGSDESKHGRMARQYLLNMLGTEVQVPKKNISEYNTFGILTKFTPRAMILLALIIEIVGNSFFKHFAEHCPEPLLKEICSFISGKDEGRHIASCKAAYLIEHESVRKTKLGKIIEEERNNLEIWVVANQLYSDHLDGVLPVALEILGIDREKLFQEIETDLTKELGDIGIEPDPTLFKTLNSSLQVQSQ